jgi:hypothetical protein
LNLTYVGGSTTGGGACVEALFEQQNQE